MPMGVEISWREELNGLEWLTVVVMSEETLAIIYMNMDSDG